MSWWRISGVSPHPPFHPSFLRVLAHSGHTGGLDSQRDPKTAADTDSVNDVLSVDLATVASMATQDATDRWDKVLEEIQRVDDSPSGRNTRRALAGGKTGADLPAANAYSVISGIYTGRFKELWAADPPQDSSLKDVLQPVHDAAHAFTPYEPMEPQIDQLLEAVSAAREKLSDGSGFAPTAERIVADMEMWLKVNLLVAGTSHLGPIKVIDDELAKQAEAVRTGFRLPPRHFDFATNTLVGVPTATSIPLAAFAASVDNTIASTWADAMQPDPADQPSIVDSLYYPSNKYSQGRCAPFGLARRETSAWLLGAAGCLEAPAWQDPLVLEFQYRCRCVKVRVVMHHREVVIRGKRRGQ
jgi:hypothetical protein